MDNLVHLPNTELEVMMALWECGSPATRKDIHDKLVDRDWPATAVFKYISRLISKGYVVCEHDKKIKRHIYTAVISEDDYLRFEASSIMGRFCGSNLVQFVSYLYENGIVDTKDMKQLKKSITKNYLEKK